MIVFSQSREVPKHQTTSNNKVVIVVLPWDEADGTLIALEGNMT
jgi:hypothetical protein